MAAGRTYTPIARTTLSAAASTVTFSSISGSYTDLVLISQAGSTAGNNNLAARLNSDTGSNYSITFLQGTGAAAASNRASNESRITLGEKGDLDSTLGSVNIAHFMNYSNTTTYKTILSRANNVGSSTSSPYGVSAVVNMWRNTAAITSIELFAATGTTFITGSTFTLYGIAAA